MTIIKSPVVTEKSTKAGEKNHYTFLVSPRANKPQIRAAIEALYGVTVTDVRLLMGKPTAIHTGRKRLPSTSDVYKKAMVTIKKGQSISFEAIKE